MIQVENLIKEYDGFTALRNITFHMNKGEMLLILGPNGSGKTTLLRCVLGLLKFYGRIAIDDIDITANSKRIKKLIGYVPQSINFPQTMTAREILNLHAKLHEIELDKEELLSFFGLKDVIDVPVREYSGGMKQRLALCIATAHNPDILILDEPTANLDLKGRRIFQNILREMKKHRRTVLISSHKIVDLLIYIDKILMLNEGKQIYFGPLETLLDRLGNIKFYIKINADITGLQLKSAEVLSLNNRWLQVEARDIIDIINELDQKRINIGPIYVEEPSLDELITYLEGRDHE